MFPAVLRVECNGTSAFALHVPTRRPTALVALHDSERPPDLALLQHAANIAALEVERITTERDLGLRMGSELLAAMLKRGIEPASAAAAAGRARDRSRERRARGVSPHAQSAANQRNLHHELVQRELPHLVLWSTKRCLAAIPDTR